MFQMQERKLVHGVDKCVLCHHDVRIAIQLNATLSVQLVIKYEIETQREYLLSIFRFGQKRASHTYSTEAAQFT